MFFNKLIKKFLFVKANISIESIMSFVAKPSSIKVALMNLRFSLVDIFNIAK